VLGDPTNPEAWNAIAYVDREAHGRLSPEGVSALDHSYAVSFFARRVAVWRVTFALQNWDALTTQTRSDAIREATLSLHDPYLAPQMRQSLHSITNPAGRLAALLLLATTKP